MLALAVLCCAGSPVGAQSFVTFESGQVRPLALTPDGSRLLATNTPDNRLEVFRVVAGRLEPLGSVPVGMEPVAVAARTNTEAWVVNHLSDSVSIVDLPTLRVKRTLLVGDEPRDIVFAGPNLRRAFITAAHRGQNVPFDPQPTTPGVGRADVWVFEAGGPDGTLGGTPLTILSLFGDTPRALAVAPGGGTVYAAVFHSGNETTTLNEGLVCDGGAAAEPCLAGEALLPGGLPAPNTNFEGVPQPETGLIVRVNPRTGAWEDELGRDWSNAVRFSLPDHDVFAIDAAATPPVERGRFAHVGTILFNMIANPANGKVYVTNTEARNDVRFEGPGTFFASTTVRGHLHEARITVLDGAHVLPRHLNKHIDYAVVPSPPGVQERSLALPLGMAIDAAGTTLYVAAFGSSRIGVFDTAELESDAFSPDAAAQIAVSGGGPSGVVLDEAQARLYVLTRFDNAVAVIDLPTRREIAKHRLYDPEPAAVRNGRAVLYDARLTSSNGEATCASCHVFGDVDSLAWDLGDPDGPVLPNPNPGGGGSFHPLKGPMTTQSLRGLADAGPMHWRGDRTGGSEPGGDPLAEDQALEQFIGAFDGLLGRDGPIAATDMQRLTAFLLQVTYPPNPNRPLDNHLRGDAAAGADFFQDAVGCQRCHTLDPTRGFFGTAGLSAEVPEPQIFKIPHLRNLYQRVGMFGMAAAPAFFRVENNQPQGPQVRGFGFLHDGSPDTLFRLLRANTFLLTTTLARELEQYLLQFDSDLAPIVGQQVTLTARNAAAAWPRVELMLQQSDAGACDVVVKGSPWGVGRGSYRLPSGLFRSDRASEPLLTDRQLLGLAIFLRLELTYTCVPPGSGRRMGVDRDGDGFLDRDELDAGTDPADPRSIPNRL